MTLFANRISSTAGSSLNNRPPFELVEFFDSEKRLKVLGLKKIEQDKGFRHHNFSGRDKVKITCTGRYHFYKKVTSDMWNFYKNTFSRCLVSVSKNE